LLAHSLAETWALPPPAGSRLLGQPQLELELQPALPPDPLATMSGTPLLDETSQPPEDWEGHCDLITITRQPSRWGEAGGTGPQPAGRRRRHRGFCMHRLLDAQPPSACCLLQAGLPAGGRLLAGSTSNCGPGAGPAAANLRLPPATCGPPVERHRLGELPGQQERAGRMDCCPSGAAVFALLRCLLASLAALARPLGGNAGGPPCS
jgi:hypothetical protein